jgi:predicted LPLAT superfamily acyltransferase
MSSTQSAPEAPLKHDAWSGKTDGKPWMQRTLIVWLRHVDVRWLYAVMALVIPFYMVFSRRAFRANYQFFRHHFGQSPLRAFCNVYLSQYHLGQVVLDRFASYAGRRFELVVDGFDRFAELARQPEGMMLLSAHVGNYELAGYTLVADDKPFNALIFAGETQTVMDGRDRAFEGNNIRMIPVAADMSHIFKLSNALSDGEIVSMPGDRIFGSQKSVVCPFLGAPAKFPLGPFALAVQREVPILTVFVMKEATWRYHVYIDKLEVPAPQGDDSSAEAQTGKTAGARRKERMEALARSYAARLEATVRQYPTQWYNYYDFWQ